MKRLLSILLMNAWGGLRHKASLPTLSMLGVSIMVLLVASTVTAGAAPHTSIPVVSQVASIVRSGISNTPLSTMLSGPSIHKPRRPVNLKAHPSISNSSPQSGTNTANSGATGSSNASNAMNSNGQPVAQTAAATLTLAQLTCAPNQPSSNAYGISAASAQLNFQTVPTVAGTITYSWEVRMDSGSSVGTVTSGISPMTQSYAAGQSSVSLGNQTIPQSITSTTNNYSFRLHVTGPVDAYSVWYSVSPQTTDGSCPQFTTQQ